MQMLTNLGWRRNTFELVPEAVGSLLIALKFQRKLSYVPPPTEASKLIPSKRPMLSEMRGTKWGRGGRRLMD